MTEPPQSTQDESPDERARRVAAAKERVRHAPADEVLAPGARTVIDVRAPDEYAADHVDGAVNVPLETLADRIGEVVGDRDTPVVTYCNGGGRGSLGAAALLDLGYTDVVDLDGGLRGLRGQS